MLKRFVLFFVLFFSLYLAGCASGDHDPLVVEEVWGRPSPESASNSAFYLLIRNTGQEDDTLVGVNIDICGRTELHRSSIDDQGVMSMQQVQQIAVPAGETTSLEPGGLHVMCIDRRSELNSGDRVSITLLFTLAGELVAEAEIKEQ